MKSSFVLGCSDCDVLSEASAFRERPETVGEEIANSVSHGIGFFASLLAAPVLILHAARNGGRVANIVGASVFSATIALLYLASTLYHALPRGRAKHVLRRVEHAVIYVLIAGTYTPFSLGVLHGPWGWSLFGITWTLALSGVLLKSFGGVRYPTISMLLYLSMGWVVILAVRPLIARMPLHGFWWILGGGVAYTAGVAFYAARHRYTHFIWHLFVMAGTVLHFFAVLWYAA